MSKWFVAIAMMTTLSQSSAHAEIAAATKCPSFEERYANCNKTAGDLPEFFSTVEISASASKISMTTQTSEGPIVTEYIPDRIVRQGIDYHYLPDGTVLPNLLSHNSSYCEDGVLHGSEVTFLPDGKVALEAMKISIDKNGLLLFELMVDSQLVLAASCAP